jgi:hypothetical protein
LGENSELTGACDTTGESEFKNFTVHDLAVLCYGQIDTQPPLSLSARFLPAACPHSFKEAAHLQGPVLSLRGVDPLAQAGDSQIILDTDEPLDFGNLRVKRINLLLNEWANHVGPILF